jgi:hypothetical protein
MLKHCAANRKRRLPALTYDVHIYTTLKSLVLQGAPYIYDFSRIRVKPNSICAEPPEDGRVTPETCIGIDS